MAEFTQIIPILLVFGVFYFLVLRPQEQERRKQEDLVASLAKDDQVVTRGGIHGRVLEVAESTVVLAVEKGARLRIDKDVVVRRLDEGSDASAARKES